MRFTTQKHLKRTQGNQYYKRQPNVEKINNTDIREPVQTVPEEYFR